MPDRVPDREELKARLTPEQFHVTQEKGTERPFTGRYEAQTGLQGYNALMNSLSGGINASLGLGNTALGNMNGAIAGMPTSTTGGNILAGAISGAASGSIVPGIGTIIGGVLGGVLGGLGGRG